MNPSLFFSRKKQSRAEHSHQKWHPKQLSWQFKQKDPRTTHQECPPCVYARSLFPPKTAVWFDCQWRQRFSLRIQYTLEPVVFRLTLSNTDKESQIPYTENLSFKTFWPKIWTTCYYNFIWPLFVVCHPQSPGNPKPINRQPNENSCQTKSTMSAGSQSSLTRK